LDVQHALVDIRDHLLADAIDIARDAYEGNYEDAIHDFYGPTIVEWFKTKTEDREPLHWIPVEEAIRLQTRLDDEPF
jgi:hypothetical protein